MGKKILALVLALTFLVGCGVDGSTGTTYEPDYDTGTETDWISSSDDRVYDAILAADPDNADYFTKAEWIELIVLSCDVIDQGGDLYDIASSINESVPPYAVDSVARGIGAGMREMC